MENLIRKLIEQNINGVDTYNHNGSTWLIFTDDKKWVIELTKDNTLWYNYNFFKSIFNFFSIDVVENQHYITKWVEDTIQNGVKDIRKQQVASNQIIEDTIQNGVKNTVPMGKDEDSIVSNDFGMNQAIQNGVKDIRKQEVACIQIIENTIQNGVKNITKVSSELESLHYGVEDTIENGVKHTIDTTYHRNNLVEDTIENGVKDTDYRILRERKQLKDVIQNGVKETLHYDHHCLREVVGTIQNGVKTKPALESHEGFMMGTPYVDKFFSKEDVEDTVKNGIKETNPTNFPSGECGYIREILKNGVKEVQPLPAQDGNMDWGIYYYRKGIPTKPFNEYLNEAIEFGIKETKTPRDGDIVSTVEWMKENNSTSYPKMIEDVIQSGKLNS